MYSHNTHGKLKILVLLLRELKVFFKSFQKHQNRMTVAQSADTCNDLQTETAGDTKQEGNKSIEEMAEK